MLNFYSQNDRGEAHGGILIFLSSNCFAVYLNYRLRFRHTTSNVFKLKISNGTCVKITYVTDEVILLIKIAEIIIIKCVIHLLLLINLGCFSYNFESSREYKKKTEVVPITPI